MNATVLSICIIHTIVIIQKELTEDPEHVSKRLDIVLDFKYNSSPHGQYKDLQLDGELH